MKKKLLPLGVVFAFVTALTPIQSETELENKFSESEAPPSCCEENSCCTDESEHAESACCEDAACCKESDCCDLSNNSGLEENVLSELTEKLLINHYNHFYFANLISMIHFTDDLLKEFSLTCDQRKDAMKTILVKAVNLTDYHFDDPSYSSELLIEMVEPYVNLATNHDLKVTLMPKYYGEPNTDLLNSAVETLTLDLGYAFHWKQLERLIVCSIDYAKSFEHGTTCQRAEFAKKCCSLNFRKSRCFSFSRELYSHSHKASFSFYD